MASESNLTATVTLDILYHTGDGCLGDMRGYQDSVSIPNLSEREAVVLTRLVLPHVAEAVAQIMASRSRLAEVSELNLAKVGINALIDEATGYQATRPSDALKKMLETEEGGEDDGE